MDENNPEVVEECNDLPIAILKQMVMKYDSALTDVCEVLEESNLNEYTKKVFTDIKDATTVIVENIVAIVSGVMPEEEFMDTSVPMDEMDEYPFDSIDEGDVLDEDLDEDE
jgi:hypothetical protein